MESRPNDFEINQGDKKFIIDTNAAVNSSQMFKNFQPTKDPNTFVSSPIKGKTYSTTTHTVVEAQTIVRKPAELPEGQTDIQKILRGSFLSDNEVNNIKIIGNPKVIKQEPVKEEPGFGQEITDAQIINNNKAAFNTPIMNTALTTDGVSTNIGLPNNFSSTQFNNVQTEQNTASQFIQNAPDLTSQMFNTQQSQQTQQIQQQSYQTKTFNASPIKGKTYSTTTHTVAEAQTIVRKPAELPEGQTDIQKILRGSFLSDNELNNIKIIGNPKVIKQEPVKELPGFGGQEIINTQMVSANQTPIPTLKTTTSNFENNDYLNQQSIEQQQTQIQNFSITSDLNNLQNKQIDFSTTNQLQSFQQTDFTTTNQQQSLPQPDFTTANQQQSTQQTDFTTTTQQSLPQPDFTTTNLQQSFQQTDFTTTTQQSLPQPDFTTSNQQQSIPQTDFSTANQLSFQQTDFTTTTQQSLPQPTLTTSNLQQTFQQTDFTTTTQQSLPQPDFTTTNQPLTTNYSLQEKSSIGNLVSSQFNLEQNNLPQSNIGQNDLNNERLSIQSHDDRINKLENYTNLLKENQQNMKLAINNLQGEVNNYKDTQNEVETLKAQNELYKQQLSELNNLRSQAAEANSLKMQLAQLTPLKNQSQEIAVIKNQLTELDTLRQKVAELNSVQAQQEELDNLRQQVGQMNELKQQLNELDILKNKTADNEILQKKVEELEMSKSKYEQEIKELRNTLSDIDSKQEQMIVTGDIIHNVDELEMIIRKINKLNKKITLNLLYKASADSDRASAFHEKCDNAKSSLVLVETDKGKRFGGFTTKSWEGDCIDKKDEESFVFSLDKMKTYDNIYGEDAIGCYPKFGPIFLGCQIRIYDNAFSKGGTTFEKGLNFNTEEDFELTGGERVFGVKDIEVYEVIPQ